MEKAILGSLNYIKQDGTNSPTADIDFNNKNLSNVGTGLFGGSKIADNTTATSTGIIIKAGQRLYMDGA